MCGFLGHASRALTVIYADWDRATRVARISYSHRARAPRSPSRRRLVALNSRKIEALEDKKRARKRREALRDCQATLSILRGERPKCPPSST